MVLGVNKVEELRSVIDEGGLVGIVDESGVSEERGKEGNVGFDIMDFEFN